MDGECMGHLAHPRNWRFPLAFNGLSHQPCNLFSAPEDLWRGDSAAGKRRQVIKPVLMEVPKNSIWKT